MSAEFRTRESQEEGLIDVYSRVREQLPSAELVFIDEASAVWLAIEGSPVQVGFVLDGAGYDVWYDVTEMLASNASAEVAAHWLVAQEC